jgi:hypothetical protein
MPSKALTVVAVKSGSRVIAVVPVEKAYRPKNPRNRFRVEKLTKESAFPIQGAACRVPGAVFKKAAVVAAAFPKPEMLVVAAVDFPPAVALLKPEVLVVAAVPFPKLEVVRVLVVPVAVDFLQEVAFHKSVVGFVTGKRSYLAGMFQSII